MRNTLVRTLVRLAKNNPDINLLTGDLGFNALEPFIDAYPNQYLNAGISEQNMVGVAAGLALSGRTVFTYSIIPFATFRCLEQIRDDVCYHKLPVCIVGVGGGYSYGNMGSTHHAIEDMAIMRALPNMTVVCPGDPAEVEAAVEAIVERKQPCYLRLGKAGEPNIHDAPLKDFKIGKSIQISEGDDLTIISNSTMLHSAQQTANILKDRGHSVRLISMHTIKPLDDEAIRKAAEQTRLVVTIEEHCSTGGLGSAVSEALSRLGTQVQHLNIAIPDMFACTVGSQQYLRQQVGLEPEQMADRIESTVAAKNH